MGSRADRMAKSRARANWSTDSPAQSPLPVPAVHTTRHPRTARQRGRVVTNKSAVSHLPARQHKHAIGACPSLSQRWLRLLPGAIAMMVVVRLMVSLVFVWPCLPHTVCGLNTFAGQAGFFNRVFV